MPVFKRVIDIMALGSDRPFRRLIGYYAILAVVVVTLSLLFPPFARLLLGSGPLSTASASRLLQDGLTAKQLPLALPPGSTLDLVIATALALVSTLALMLPVSWVYMSARRGPGHDQSVAQTLIFLPLVVAGIVLVVRDSLALAFSLAGVVAGVRFRARMKDTRDTVFIFLAIAVGFAAGVQSLAVGALVSVVFNIVLLLTWRYDFGRNVLEPTAAVQWSEPLNSLAAPNGNGHGRIPDRDLVLALTPSKVKALAERFERVREVLGPGKKKPRFNAVLSITTDKVGDAQVLVQKALDQTAKRWMLDEVVTNVGKPSEIYYLVRLGKAVSRDDLITAIRTNAGDKIMAADVEIGEALEKEKEEATA